MNEKGMRRADVYVQDRFAGVIRETGDGGYEFVYDKEYAAAGLPAVSLTMRPMPNWTRKISASCPAA